MKPLLVAGDINVDLVFSGCDALPAWGREMLAGEFRQGLGGSAAICAMGLARLGESVAFAGLAGGDPWGDGCLAALREAGIDVGAVRRHARLPTGVTVALSSAHDRALVTSCGAIAALREQDLDDASLARAGHLHVSSYYLQRDLRPGLPALFARARRAGLSISLDPGFDPRQRWRDDGIAELLEWVDLFLPNAAEACAISGAATPEAALRVLANGRTRTVVKCGSAGCATLDDDGRVLRVPAHAVDAVDTTGAGDSFDAGFLYAWRRGLPLRECLGWGSACGSLSTRGAGGTASQATAAEVRALLAAAP